MTPLHLLLIVFGCVIAYAAIGAFASGFAASTAERRGKTEDDIENEKIGWTLVWPLFAVYVGGSFIGKTLATKLFGEPEDSLPAAKPKDVP